MADSFRAHFDGTGNLSAYTPEIGTITAVAEAEVRYATPIIRTWSGSCGSINSLSSFARTGDGAVEMYDNSACTIEGKNAWTAWRGPTQGADGFAEVVVRLPYSMSPFYAALQLRGNTSPNSEDDPDWSYGVPSVGLSFAPTAGDDWGVEVRKSYMANTQHRTQVLDSFASGEPVDDYVDMRLRVEVEGTAIRAFINNVLFVSDTIPGGYPTGAGNAWLGIYWNSDNPGDTPLLLSWRVGDLPYTEEEPTGPDVFWQHKVKCKEIDN